MALRDLNAYWIIIIMSRKEDEGKEDKSMQSMGR